MSLLQVNDLHVDFPVKKREGLFIKTHQLHAVNGVSFSLEKGQCLGVVGESGCGKSTLVRAICGLNPPTSGEVIFDGKPVDYSSKDAVRKLRSNVQMIFQDPMASLNPRMTISQILHEPLKQFFPELSETERDKRIREMVDRVGILPSYLSRYPHEFSGGQCQRIGIARALVCEPKLLVCDEPVSALDVSIQAQVVNLLKSLQKEFDLTLIFVAHDLGVVRTISDNVMVMYLGSMMEYGRGRSVIDDPLHPYTQALLSAIPVADPKVKVEPQILIGDLPSPLNMPVGCPFQTRCPLASDECRQGKIPVVERDGRQVACVKV